MSTTHRSTSVYKVKNKRFKGGGTHRSKSAVRRSQGKGKVEKEKKTVKAQTADNSKASQKAKTMQKMKAERDQKRQLKKEGGIPPKAVLILSFSSNLEANLQLKAQLVGHCAAMIDHAGPVTVNPPTFGKKSKFTFMAVDPKSVFDVLEACLVADVLIPVVDAKEGVSPEGVKLASTIKAQGLMTVLPVITGMANVASNLRHATKKGLLQDLTYLFPNVSRVLPADENDGDLLQIFRFLDAARLSELHFRNPRSFVLAEKVVFEQNNPGNPEAGVLRVTGYVRGGSGLSCDSLVHIPGLGDLQLDRVTDLESGVVLHSATDLRPSLQAENEPDPFAGGEQTWPTAADVEMAGLSDEEEGEDAIQEAVKGRKLRRRIPAGMSDYQAAWLPESDEEEEEDEEDEDEDHQVKQMDESSGGEEVPPKQMYNSDEEDEKKNDDAMKDDDDDEDNVVEKERDEQRWPDEVEAPHDMPARERFQKYRGLDSFRTAAWDPRENLPVEYSRIFQLANYAHFVRRNGQPLENPPIQTGAHVVLHLQCPARLAAVVGALAHRPLVIGTLLKHENKISVLHFDVMKHHDFTEPVASGETLIACFGLHRLQVVPIFSQHVPGCEKCKYERFLPSGASAMSMASFFGPITISPCSITLFRMVDGVPVLVASGTLRTANSDLLLIKKVVLTAHPSRVHKRTAVCKGMFYFPADVRWFKPVGLWTKQGRIGHIKESNGTKGAFKAVFDGQLNNSDVVCLSLYKRVFPKWKFENFYGK